MAANSSGSTTTTTTAQEATKELGHAIARGLTSDWHFLVPLFAFIFVVWIVREWRQAESKAKRP